MSFNSIVHRSSLSQGNIGETDEKAEWEKQADSSEEKIFLIRKIGQMLID